VSATESADELGAIQAANMVMLGAYLARRPVVKAETILDVLRKVLPKRRHHLIGINEQALRRGRELAQAPAAGAGAP
jgi:2-oxoglutarate ferredoxin oxidoreductase subunit gamma